VKRRFRGIFALAFSLPVSLAPLATAANEAHRLMSSISEPERNRKLTAFMQSSGEQCEVTRSFYRGSTKEGHAFWALGCRGGRAWQVMIYNDAKGSTKILECAMNQPLPLAGARVLDLSRKRSVGATGYAELEPYQGATGKATTLTDTIFSTVPGAAVFVGKSPRYRAKNEKLGIDVDLKGHNALQSVFVFHA
jgi:hypothetical protein